VNEPAETANPVAKEATEVVGAVPEPEYRATVMVPDPLKYTVAVSKVYGPVLPVVHPVAR